MSLPVANGPRPPIVLDANILISAILGRRVRQLIEDYSGQGVRFFAPDVSFDDAQEYLPMLLEKRGNLMPISPNLRTTCGGESRFSTATMFT